MENKNSGFSTKAIHHGYDPMDEQGALTPPLHLTSTFAFDSAEHGGAIFEGEQAGFFYSRISNPTCDLLEKRIAVLEGTEAAIANSSGMGSITSVMWTFLSPGDEVLCDETLYGCTFAFFHHGLAKFGVKITHVDMTDPANVRAAISDKTKIVYFETVANPNMRLVDVAAVSEIAHEHGAKVVVDNTYTTPYLMRPIELGADMVVHSATKYLGGHGDVIAGMVAGSEEDMEQVRLVGMKDMTGAVMAPFNAMLILRGLKTLELRMDRHCQNAQKVAEALEAHPMVSDVMYPGLESFPQHELAKRTMKAFGGMIAFEVIGGIEAGKATMNGLGMIKRAVSLGDAETLIQHPASMTHSTYTPDERAEHLISEGLIRVSVGLEDPDDIIADLLQALPAADQMVA